MFEDVLAEALPSELTYAQDVAFHRSQQVFFRAARRQVQRRVKRVQPEIVLLAVPA
jgi:hypothetical protein